MEEQRTKTRVRYRDRGCGCGFGGCGGFFVVLTLGILLAILHTVAGVGVSVRIPLTASNITVAGAIGAKDRVAGALPIYTEGRLGGNQNFFNNSTTMTIGPAEGVALVIIGTQDGAPPVDLHLELH
jgi:hypothetical protein